MSDYDGRILEKNKSEFSSYRGSDETINAIIDSVVVSATNREVNAGYSGAHDDGGARVIKNTLKSFLEGISYAKTGVTEQYADLIRKINNEKDSEYLKYIELKAKFGD